MKGRIRVFPERLAQTSSLDGVAEKVAGAFSRLVGPGRLKDTLSGTWLGHPAHPMLTDVVVGAWTSALVLDLLPGDATDRAADSLVGVGTLAALPTAVTGLSDWADTSGAARRVGTVHGIGNVAAASLFGLSFLARRRGRRGAGVLLSGLGFATATLTAYLGGHLTYGRGVGVDETTFEEQPGEWTPVLEEDALPEGSLTPVDAGGTGVVLYRSAGAIYGLANRCTHRGCSLHEGEVEEESLSLTCPCHGSTFRLTDGGILRGPATAPEDAYDVRVSQGMVEVRARG